MWYRIGADLVLLLHLAFVLFVIAGGLLTMKWRWISWVHLPAAAWGAIVELTGWICPLTPLENSLRAKAGESVYASDFVGHYVIPLLYPAALTRSAQVFLGLMVLLVNVGLYWWILSDRRRGNRNDQGATG